MISVQFIHARTLPPLSGPDYQFNILELTASEWSYNFNSKIYLCVELGFVFSCCTLEFHGLGLLLPAPQNAQTGLILSATF